jgi:hypothetical protein
MAGMERRPRASTSLVGFLATLPHDQEGAMRRALAYSLTIGAVLGGTLVALPTALASADVVTPMGACTASGQWAHAGFTRNSTDYSPSDVVLVPQRDVVNWEGHEFGKPIGYFGPARAIDGAVQLHIPFGVNVSIWHWSGQHSQRYSNRGQESYNLPSALIGIKLKLSGYENDDKNRVCTGSVYLEVSGSKLKNPVGWAGLVGTAVFLAGLVIAGFRKTKLAYDDINP